MASSMAYALRSLEAITMHTFLQEELVHAH
jgi:hypothetical protein